jgi:hypothetical protein
MNLNQEQIKVIQEFGDFSIHRKGDFWSLSSPKIIGGFPSRIHVETGEIQLGLEEAVLKLIEWQQCQRHQSDDTTRSTDSRCHSRQS